MNYQCFQGIIICTLVVFVDVSLIKQQDAPSPNVNDTTPSILSENIHQKTNAQNELKIANEVLHDSNNSEISKNISLVGSQAFDAYHNKTGYSPRWLSTFKSGALQRTGLVTLGVTSVVVLFFIVRAIRVRHRRSKSRKYGVITSTASEMEMEPLEGRGILEDDDEEETLYDSQQKYLIK